MKLPKLIDPCPIIEAIIEIRFESKLISDAIFGVIYNSVKETFPKTENLPILQIPENIRINDPNLKYNPYYSLLNNNFILQIGPKVVSLINKGYDGWYIFVKKSSYIINTLKKLDIINSIERIGLRYTNFFENKNIFDFINFDVSFNKSKINNELIIRANLKGENKNYNNGLQISNNVKLKIDNQIKSGSIIDIDTSIIDKEILNNFFKNHKDILENAHYEEKYLFFSLLKNDFLKTLNPEY
ncbi:MAG: TIGR04255 family protein [Spirochaetes bacterium]|nr:TIGR04255 family protein [Spirochaetota bacterium]